MRNNSVTCSLSLSSAGGRLGLVCIFSCLSGWGGVVGVGVGGNHGQDQDQGSIKPGTFAHALPRGTENRGTAAAFRTFFLRCIPLVATMSTNQPSSTDPTKMGVGRSIAVLTSGGDAQGEPRSGSWPLIAGWATDRSSGSIHSADVTESRPAVRPLS